MAQHLIKSDRTIQAQKPQVKRLNDGAGLHLRINNCRGVWYQDCNMVDHRTSLSLGAYPEVSLAEARRRSLEMRTDMANGIDPSGKRKAQKKAESVRRAAVRLLGRQDAQVGSLEHVARQWYELRRKRWSKDYAESEISRLKTHLFPILGHRAIGDIRREEFTQFLAAIDETGKNSTSRRVYGHCKRICDFAVAHGFLQINVCRDLDEALQSDVTRHHAAITSPEILANFLKDVDAYPGAFVTVSAMKILMHTFLRSSELRWAEWSEIDLDAGVWRVPAERMKDSLEGKLNGPPHLVPLSTQVIQILRCLEQITGGGAYVFAGQGWKNPVLSENTINEAIRAMGYSTKDDQTAHGFRATARTILVERRGWSADIVELQLDHQVLDSNGRAYNRTELESARRELMQEWSDYLDALKEGKKPVDVPHHGLPLVTGIRLTHQVYPSVHYTFNFAGISGVGKVPGPATP